MKTNNKSALYIHIPFCVKKCAYCDFASYEDFSLQEAYFKAVKKEMAMVADEWNDYVFDTVFIGGGTPTSAKDIYIESVLEKAHKKFQLYPKEVTIEANPGTVDENNLRFYLYLGINRISFGVQSSKDHLLKAVGRIHDFETAKESVQLARHAGFPNISVDLMSGLPGQKESDLIHSIDESAKMGVNHISMYSLKVEDNTPLQSMIQSGEAQVPDKDSEYVMAKAARQKLSQLGYTRYEISNYAKNKNECLHNLHYWHNDDYLGVGLAASSGRGGLRTTNTRDINEYIKRIGSGQNAYEENAQSSSEEYAFETLMLGLRLVEGIDLAEYKSRHDIDLTERFEKEISDLKRRKLADIYEGSLFLTEEGMDIQNTVLVEFIEGFNF